VLADGRGAFGRDERWRVVLRVVLMDLDLE
jgi:hypothetical protein